MPLYNDDDTPIPPPPSIPAASVIETASVYQNTNERVKAVPYIEGNTWTVEYYGRLIGNSDPATLDTDITDPTLMQFQLVKNMELRVTQELSQTTDEQTQLTTVTGVANMYPIVIPIIGDVFLAPLGDGNWGKFTITSTERQSIYKESAWTITYTQGEYVSEPLLELLNDRVVQTLIFDLNGLNEAGGALATESEWNRNVLRKKYIIDMVNWYYEEFYHPTIKTFLVPDEFVKLYDPYVVEFWNFLIGKELNGGRLLPHQFDVRSSIFKTDYVTVWDAIQKQSNAVLSRAVHSMAELPTSVFALGYINFTIHSSGLDKIIYPHEVNGLAVTGGTDLPVNPLIPYIFSAEFYANASTGQSDLELLVHQMIDGTIIPFNDVKALYLELKNRTPLQRFYEIPLLIALLTVSR